MTNEVPEIVALQDELCEKFLEDGSTCPELAVYRCIKCNKMFCIDHASKIDPVHHCEDCLHVELASEPLVDAEGTRHSGRILRPVGNSFTAMNRLISDMTDDELKDFIKGYIVLVHEAEQLKTMREITLSHAKHEALGREIAKIEKLGGEIYFPSKKPHVVKTSKTEKMSDSEQLAAKLKKAGITPDMLRAIIDANAKKGVK